MKNKNVQYLDNILRRKNICKYILEYMIIFILLIINLKSCKNIVQ